MSRLKKKRRIFLFGKLALADYVSLVALMVVFATTFLLIFGTRDMWHTLESALGIAPRIVPARTIQTTHNTSYLWHKDDYIAPKVESASSLFFSLNNRMLVFPAADIPSFMYTLKAVDVVSGQTRWQTDIVRPGMIRVYEGKFVVLSTEWQGQAPAKPYRQLPYCSFGQQHYSISTYDINTGENEWSYGYGGMNIPDMTFENQRMVLAGSDDHGESRLFISVDMNTGFIIDQQCTKMGDGYSLPGFPKFSQGIQGTAFEPASTEAQEAEGCSRDNRYCFVTEGNRLHILNGGAKEFLGYVDFEGSPLTANYIDILVLNKVGVIHLDDSDQLFAFRLP
ncbi:MAG TPA: hypothetical protein PLD25_02170 [Chloroflexota bacterium]|nr:hypothetical protein [Chloroflexota bacterium]HUM67412.1 hypothetical protein [Chloroflexota bacterium]